MTAIINTKLGLTRGKKRLWLEGGKLLREGINPGAKFDLEFRDKKLVIRICEAGKYTVSRRERAGKTLPIIDLVQHDIGDLFEGVDLLRACVRNGLIVVSAHQRTESIIKRVEQLKKKILSGDSLSVCSLFHGGGVLDKAIHHGLESAGIQSHVEIVVEIESAYLESSLANNPELWSASSIIIESPIEQVSIRSGIEKQIDLLVAGIPCTGASKAGKSKNKLEFAESHQSAGAMFFYVLNFIQVFNPAIVLLENVSEYATTASMQVIRAVLTNLGYDIQERILDGNEFGALERRKRLCVVASCQELGSCFDINTVLPVRTKEPVLNDVLMDVPLDAPCWRSFDYLADKELRDMSAGKGFKRQLLSGEESYLGVLGRHYCKARSTEPFIIHPQDSSLSRLLTPVEHAKVKAIPVGVINGLSDTIAHQVLGQSVIYPAFESVAKHLGESIYRWAHDSERLLIAA
jgi:DNA (cytosine-5)-methyltransferase 1